MCCYNQFENPPHHFQWTILLCMLLWPISNTTTLICEHYRAPQAITFKEVMQYWLTLKHEVPHWGTPLVYYWCASKKMQTWTNYCKIIKADIHCWSGKKLLRCTKNYESWRMKANFAEENIAIFLSWTMLCF